jgi:hypothetical protein
MAGTRPAMTIEKCPALATGRADLPQGPDPGVLLR